MKLSIIYPYRNRDVFRVRKSLQSLLAQIDDRAEILFIDYGSDLPLIDQNIQELTNSLVKYHYIDTRGKLWSRSEALNQGIDRASGEYIMISDVDLIFSDGFINHIFSKLDERTVLHYRCFYLKKNQSKINIKRLEVSSTDALGLMVVSKNGLELVGKFDPKYKIWGGEDNDVSKRLEDVGFKKKWIDYSQFYTFHQWHESSNFKTRKKIPGGWHRYLMTYFQSELNEFSTSCLPNINQINFEELTPIVVDIKNYPVFALTEVVSNYKQKLGNEEFLEIIFIEQVSNLDRFTKFSNKLLKFLNLPLRFISENIYYGYSNDFFQVRDSVIYYLEYDAENILDYRLTIHENSINVKLKFK